MQPLLRELRASIGLRQHKGQLRDEHPQQHGSVQQPFPGGYVMPGTLAAEDEQDVPASAAR